MSFKTKENFEKWYENEDPWNIKASRIFIDRLNAIWTNVIPTDRSKKIVLDCGCGEGTITGNVTKDFGLAIGVDISRKALVRAKHRLRQCDFVEADVRYLPFKDKSIDYVSCFETLYYLKDDYEIAVDEFARIVFHKGRIILSIHLGKNYFNYRSLMAKLNRSVQKSAIYCLQVKFRSLFENGPALALGFALGNRLPSILATKIVIVCKLKECG